jgi:hypothetical protein
MGYGLAFGQGRLTLSLGLISVLPPLTVAWAAARQKSLVVPFVLFAATYGGYNGLLLMRLACLNWSDYPYPIELTNAAIVKSGVLSALGAVGIVLAWLFRTDRGPLRPVDLTPQISGNAFRIGVVLFFATLGLYWLQMHQMGGFVAVMSTERVERFQLMKDTFSIPYIPSICTTVGLLFVGSAGKKLPRRVAWLAFAFWAAVLGLQGDRGVILQVTMVVAAILGTMCPSLCRIRIATLAGAGLLIFVALVFEQVRPFLALAAAGGGDIAVLGEYAGHIDLSRSIQPEKSELGGPYLSVIESASIPRQMLLGKSYLEAIPMFLPRFLYPGRKSPDLSTELAESVSFGDAYVMGWGYSPVAEAYRNFGIGGVPIVLAAWGTLFLWLGRMQSRGLWGLLASSTLLMEAVVVNRIDFRSIYIGTVFNLGVLLIAVGLTKALDAGGKPARWPISNREKQQ